jgi:hypothetical protein
METGHGRGRGAGQGGCGYGRSAQGNRPGGKQHIGVDITDLTHNFTAEEWQKLSPEVIQQIKNAREAAKSENKKRKVAAVGNATPDETAYKEQASANPSAEDVASNGNSFGNGAYPTNRNKRVGFNNNRHQTS